MSLSAAEFKLIENAAADAAATHTALIKFLQEGGPTCRAHTEQITDLYAKANAKAAGTGGLATKTWIAVGVGAGLAIVLGIVAVVHVANPAAPAPGDVLRELRTLRQGLEEWGIVEPGDAQGVASTGH